MNYRQRAQIMSERREAKGEQETGTRLHKTLGASDLCCGQTYLRSPHERSLTSTASLQRRQSSVLFQGEVDWNTQYGVLSPDIL